MVSVRSYCRYRRFPFLSSSHTALSAHRASASWIASTPPDGLLGD